MLFFRAWCLLKPGGLALVGVPVHHKEYLAFNGCRLYGPIALPHLFANFKQVYTEMDTNRVRPDCYWCYQPLFVAQKKDL